MRLSPLAFLACLAVAPAAAETCAQSQLGTSGNPKNWSVAAPGANGQLVECLLTIKGRTAVSGKCRSEPKAPWWSTIAAARSEMRLTSTCGLTGTLDSTAVLATLSGTYTTGGWPSPRGYGKLTRKAPGPTATFTFTLLRRP